MINFSLQYTKYARYKLASYRVGESVYDLIYSRLDGVAATCLSVHNKELIYRVDCSYVSLKDVQRINYRTYPLLDNI